MNRSRPPTRFDSLLPREVYVAETEIETLNECLTPTEQIAIQGAAAGRVLEFTAGRSCARRALALAGGPHCSIPIGSGRAPIFPKDYCGSITHSATYCAAAVARVGAVISVGIDAEPNERLDRAIEKLIALPSELEMIDRLPSGSPINWSKLVFSIKESLYKAYFQICRSYLDFLDAAVDLDPETRTFAITPVKAQESMQGKVFRGTFDWDHKFVYSAALIRANDWRRIGALETSLP